MIVELLFVDGLAEALFRIPFKGTQSSDKRCAGWSWQTWGNMVEISGSRAKALLQRENIITALVRFMDGDIVSNDGELLTNKWKPTSINQCYRNV